MSYIPVPGLFRARMASTANLTLSGNQTIDTIVGAAGNVVLARNQTTATQNGLYVMAAGAWARLPGADNAAELVPGSLVIVSEGTANVAGSVFELTTAAGFVVGTNNLTFPLLAAPGASGVALAVTAPADVGTVAAVGVGTTAARADHVHDFNATDTATVTWDFTTPGTRSRPIRRAAWPFRRRTRRTSAPLLPSASAPRPRARITCTTSIATDTATVSWDFTTPGDQGERGGRRRRPLARHDGDRGQPHHQRRRNGGHVRA